MYPWPLAPAKELLQVVLLQVGLQVVQRRCEVDSISTSVLRCVSEAGGGVGSPKKSVAGRDRGNTHSELVCQLWLQTSEHRA